MSSADSHGSDTWNSSELWAHCVPGLPFYPSHPVFARLGLESLCGLAPGSDRYPYQGPRPAVPASRLMTGTGGPATTLRRRHAGGQRRADWGAYSPCSRMLDSCLPSESSERHGWEPPGTSAARALLGTHRWLGFPCHGCTKGRRAPSSPAQMCHPGRAAVNDRASPRPSRSHRSRSRTNPTSVALPIVACNVWKMP